VQVTDLLEPALTSLQLREDQKRGVYVAGLTEHDVRTASETLALLKRGALARHVGSTQMNEKSSRSHTVFSMVLESTQADPVTGITKHCSSRLHLIDLAGSERQSSTQAAGDRLKEASNINSSLSVLGTVIRSLAEIQKGKARYVHYRDSKLTFLLRDSLGGNAKTCVIATVSPSAESIGETLSTLMFAQRAKSIKNRAVKNEDITGNDVAKLKDEIRRLQTQLSSRDALGSVPPPMPSSSRRSSIGLALSSLATTDEAFATKAAERRQSSSRLSIGAGTGTTIGQVLQRANQRSHERSLQMHALHEAFATATEAKNARIAELEAAVAAVGEAASNEELSRLRVVSAEAAELRAGVGQLVQLQALYLRERECSASAEADVRDLTEINRQLSERVERLKAKAASAEAADVADGVTPPKRKRRQLVVEDDGASSDADFGHRLTESPDTLELFRRCGVEADAALPSDVPLALAMPDALLDAELDSWREEAEFDKKVRTRCMSSARVHVR
jgi:kinesin family protein 15